VVSRKHGFRFSRLLDSRVFRFQGTKVKSLRIQGSEVLKFLGIKFSWFQSLRTPRLLCFRILKFQGSGYEI
jgi:hypothetical protein